MIGPSWNSYHFCNGFWWLYFSGWERWGSFLNPLPFEMIMIGGAAAGAFVLSNDKASIKHTLKDLQKVF